VVYSALLFRHLPEDGKENHEKLKIFLSLVRPRFESTTV
jgi:hypothetical protein